MNYPSEASLAKQEQWMREKQIRRREREQPTPESRMDRRRMPWPRQHEERSLIPSTWPALEAAVRVWGAPMNGVSVPFRRYHQKRTTQQ